MSYQRLKNKVAIITGGSKGIGLGIAKTFAAEGAKVIITGRNQQDLGKAAASISNQVDTAIVDMKKSSDITNMIEMVLKKCGRIDILCQNAGIYPTALLRDMSETEWDEVIDTNLKGSFLITKACLSVMEKQQYGRIVMVSSITGPKVAQPGFAHYAASKGG